MQWLGNKVLDASLSLYIWGKNVGKERHIPKIKQSEYRQCVKSCIKQGKDASGKRESLSVFDTHREYLEMQYNEITNNNTAAESNLEEYKKGFNKLKKNTKPNTNIPIWCSAALAAADGIGRILCLPFDKILKRDTPKADRNDNRLIIMGDVHNDPHYVAKLRQKIRNTLVDPQYEGKEIIVACEGRLYDKDTKSWLLDILEKDEDYAYRREQEIAMCTEFFDNPRVKFVRIDKERDAMHSAFWKVMDDIIAKTENAAQLNPQDFEDIGKMLDHCFLEKFSDTETKIETKALDTSFNQSIFGSVDLITFCDLRKAIDEKDENNLRIAMKLLCNKSYREHVGIEATSYVRSIYMLHEGRELAKKHPDSPVIMFMGEFHSDDLKIAAPKANFS